MCQFTERCLSFEDMVWGICCIHGSDITGRAYSPEQENITNTKNLLISCQTLCPVNTDSYCTGTVFSLLYQLKLYLHLLQWVRRRLAINVQ